jgi:hypothetical protein
MSEAQVPAIQSNILILEDNTDNSLFHVESGDYFAMIATLLGFVEETAAKLEEKDETMKIARAELQLLKKNLMYLQENYSIEPKKESE